MSGSDLISDVRLLQRLQEGPRVLVLKDGDHVLRRFGQLDIFRLAAGERIDSSKVLSADEVWYVIEGRVAISLEDKRQGSPSEGVRMEVVLPNKEGSLLLVPFGVASSVEANGDTSLLRLVTHSEAKD